MSRREDKATQSFAGIFRLVFMAGGAVVAFLTILALIATAVLFLTNIGKHVTASQPSVVRHVQVNLNIIVNQPGYLKDWPAYAPSNLNVPAYSIVTVTLHDADLGDTPIAKNLPFNKVMNTVGNVAYLNGHPYSSLASDKVAHTFTIDALHVNVPLPGDGSPSDTISFTFRMGGPDLYTYHCYVPCGIGIEGWQGAMETRGYMIGTITAV